MAYELEVYPDVEEQIDALPPEVRAALGRTMTVLALVPWNGLPYNDDMSQRARLGRRLREVRAAIFQSGAVDRRPALAADDDVWILDDAVGVKMCTLT